MFYHAEHPDVDFEIETLPRAGSGERESSLQQRRVALMAGKAPDIYLMPTINNDQITKSQRFVKDFEGLFRDVSQAQTNSWFADISSLYDADVNLHTEELNQAVMDAGVVGDARFILPLGYTFDVLFVETDKWKQATEKVNTVASDDTLGVLLEADMPELLPHEFRWYHLPLNDFSAFCDYSSEKVLLKEEEAAFTFKRLNRLYLAEADHFSSIQRPNYQWYSGYLNGNSEYAVSPFDENISALRVDLAQCVRELAVPKCTGQDITMAPFRTASGDLVADITYWGAISSNCKNVDAAYDFLRLFLLPEVQYGGTLTDSNGTAYPVQFEVHDAPGWPVRYKGFAQARWEDICTEIESMAGREDRKKELLALTIDDNDFSILDEEIAYARFPSSLDQEAYALLERLLEEKVSDSEIEEIAKNFVRNLKYHLAEG